MMKWLFRLGITAILILTCISNTNIQNARYSEGPIEPPSPSIISKSMVNFNNVRFLFCGSFSGTGVLVGDDRILTAAHVARGGKCLDVKSGNFGEVTEVDNIKDYAIIQFRPNKLPKNTIDISCAGFQRNHTYYAIGWEKGADLVINRMVGTGVHKTIELDYEYLDLAVLFGRIITGMSGGPIVDENGQLIGIVNVTDEPTNRGFSREMQDTPFCKKVKD